MSTNRGESAVRVRSKSTTVRGANRTYVGCVQIGRGAECDVQVSADVVSRVHAQLVFDEGHWWIEDRESTNGTYRDGERIERRAVTETTTIRLGREGPQLVLEPERRGHRDTEGQHTTRSPGERVQKESAAEASSSRTSGRKGTSSPAPSRRSVTQYIEAYFREGETESDEHAQMIQRAYRKARVQQRRKYLGVITVVLLLCVGLSAYALVQHLRNHRLREQAQSVWRGMKEQKVVIAQLKRTVEASANTTLENRLAELEQQRRQQEERYRGYVDELGLHRDLSPKEEAIYEVARLFGESEFSIPAGFVRRVRKKIQTYWTGPAREDYVQAIRRAERKGYIPLIVKTLREHNLPPEFFYLALQESRFDRKAVGPQTRWGIAKGVWQFIPKTARAYDLEVGPRVEERVPDPRDERHDVKKSTRAAADYLQTIYSTRAQASGLLVVASYNWGEHRVVEKMDRMPGPQSIPKQAMKGIPEDPESRNYWQFLTTFEERMPEETKDYVLKVFSAAVIGHAPDLFGFSFEDPLQEHLEAPAAAASSESEAEEFRGSRPAASL